VKVHLQNTAPRPLKSICPAHSCRKAIAGSTCVARLAGT
jgi:hypothetical protein